IKLRIENPPLFRRRYFSIPLIFCKFVSWKKYRLSLVEIEPQVLLSPALRQYFFRCRQFHKNIP
ncbi:hypothetical protein AAH994_15735, partial [Weeksellaceae bacterium A-14]